MKISMDGKGRYNDNIFVERLWRTVKYEEVYLKAYANATEARRELSAYFRFYNDQRPHQALGCRTPAEVFHEARNATVDRSNVTEGPPERVLVSLARRLQSATTLPRAQDAAATSQDTGNAACRIHTPPERSASPLARERLHPRTRTRPHVPQDTPQPSLP